MTMFRWGVLPPKKRPKVGDKRVVSRFLWWPTRAGAEVRWIGFSRVQQEAYLGTYRTMKWRNVKWVDNP